MPLVVHPHFHSRYTGVSRHIEAVARALGPAVETRVMGAVLDPELPRIELGEVISRARKEEVIWHAHRINELIVGLGLRPWTRELRVIWTRHATGTPTGLTRLLARRADTLVSVSPESAETLGLPSIVIGHGVDLGHFSPPPDRREAWRALGVGGTHGIGVVGRVRPDKGQGDFVAAIAPLLSRHPDWRAVLVGLVKERDRAWLAELQARLPALHLAGESTEVAQWYRGLSIVVAPSHVESYGLARAEAMASGCCLVTTRLNALDRLIEHGRTGFLHDVGDVEALRGILDPLLADPARVAEIGAGAAQLARAQLGIEHEAGALLGLYRSLWDDSARSTSTR